MEQTMSVTTSAPAKPVSVPTPKYSQQMRAVLTVFAADSGLYGTVSPAIDFANESFDWEQIFSLALSPDQKLAADWAFCLWRDEIRDGANLYDSLLSADPHLQRAIVKALSVRLGV
jgi:hypothetical protein